MTTIHPLLAVSNGALALMTVVALAAIGIITVLLHRRRRNVWQRFAKLHGFREGRNDNGLRLIGEQNGYEITLSISPAGSDTGILGVEQVVMSLALDLADRPAGLRIESVAGFIGDLQRALDDRVVTTGNAAFDRDLLISGTPPEAARNWLTNRRQLALMDLATRHADKTLTLDEHGLHLQTRTAVSRLRVLNDMLAAMLKAAVDLDAAPGSGPTPVEASCVSVSTVELR